MKGAMRLEGLSLAGGDVHATARTMRAEVDRFYPEPPVSPALADVARTAARSCRMAAAGLIDCAARLEALAKEARP